MIDNALRRLQFLGQSVWVSTADRSMIVGGTLQRMIEEDGVSGVAAVVPADWGSGGPAVPGRDAGPQLALEEAIEVADLLAPVYRMSGGSNGFASLEVALPRKALGTEEIVAAAHALWSAVGRPNVLIKVPATPAGLQAAGCLIADGIGVNAGMIYSIDRYWDVVDAYLSGLEARQIVGQPVGHIVSVATFDLASIDALIEPWLARLALDAGPWQERALQLSGKSALACAKMAYQDFRLALLRPRFQALANKDAQPQRLVWDSSGAQGPEACLRYIEPLIGPDTICALSPETLDVYRERGCPTLTLSKGFAEADEVLSDLHALGIDVNRIDPTFGQEADPAIFVAAFRGRNAMSAASP